MKNNNICGRGFSFYKMGLFVIFKIEDVVFCVSFNLLKFCDFMKVIFYLYSFLEYFVLVIIIFILIIMWIMYLKDGVNGLVLY